MSVVRKNGELTITIVCNNIASKLCNHYITTQYTTCVGRSKASAGQYFLYFPPTRAIYILPRKVISLIHTLIFRMLQKKLDLYIYIYIYIVELVTFTCGMEFCILKIIKNAIIFTVADIYE